MDAAIVSLFEKRAFIGSLSEDEFRDKVIRPLFIRKGYTAADDLCGPDEAGKDCYFRKAGPFGQKRIEVVQTKRGNLNLGRKHNSNVIEAATQLKTALETKVNDLLNRTKQLPNAAYLCASGVINQQAKAHIIDSVLNPNLSFLDIDALVPELDEHFPELWHGIAAERLPYLRNLEKKLLSESDFSLMQALVQTAKCESPISDKGFVNLRLTRSYMRPEKKHGVVTRSVEVESTHIETLLKSNQRTRILILGEGGSGKSTLLKRGAEILCKAGIAGTNGQIPVLIRALDVATSQRALATEAIVQTQSLGFNETPAFAANEFEAGTVCLLIDAIDEIGSKQGFDTFCCKLRTFDEQYPKCRVILSSRHYSYITAAEALSNYTHYRIATLGLKEASQIVKNVGRSRLLKVERVREVMRQVERIHGFDLNPLVVTIFAASAETSRRDIPANITELFAKFTEYMLGRWDSEKGISQQFHANLKGLLLQAIAYEMHSEKRIRIDPQTMRRIVIANLVDADYSEEDADGFIDEIVDRSGLLRRAEGGYEFSHMLIQEYFAGKGIPTSDLNGYGRDEWWRRALIFRMGSHPNDAQPLLNIIHCVGSIDYRSLFDLAVTVGLATQACYFIKAPDRIKLIKWTIDALAAATAALQHDVSQFKFPLNTFLGMYLIGRDAVASNCTRSLPPPVTQGDDSESDGSKISSEDEALEFSEFWTIVGLMEAGHLSRAIERLKAFSPTNKQLLVAIHMGAFLIERVRSSTTEERSLAAKIRQTVEPAALPGIRETLREYKTQLLEIQKGEIKELADESSLDEED